MSKKRTIRRRGLSAVLSVLLCLSMLPMGALAEEPDGSEDAARNTIVEKADTKNIENTTDNDAVVEDAIVENAVVENDAVASSDDADVDAQDVDALDIDADAVDVQAAVAEHVHPICGSGDACTDPNHASHEVITDWQPIGSESELRNTQANGHYYLTANIIFNRYWRCSNSIVLCLNGHSITFQKASTASDDGISIGSNTNFTICDCSENQTGTITGSTQNGVKVSGGNSIFNMYGGKITGNSNDAGKEDAYGGGVRVTYGSTFNMYGGEISGNQSISSWYSYGGGVCVEDKGSIFNMYGGKITGNTAGNGSDVALYWYGRMCLSGAPILGDIYLVDLNNGGIDVGEGGLAENTTYQINFAGMESSSMVLRCIGTMSKEDAGHFPAPSGTKYDQGNPWSAWYNGEQLFFVRESAKHQGGIHPICGDGADCTAPDHAENHENIAWTPVEYIHTETHGDEEWIEPGNYYLTKDTILANSAYTGQNGTAAVDATHSNVNIYGGKICNNTAVGKGNVAHGIDVIWSDLTISGGEITGNSGYGVCMTDNEPKTILSGGKITGNTKGNFCFIFRWSDSNYVFNYTPSVVLDKNMAPDTNIGISVSPLEDNKVPYTLSVACDTDNSRFFYSDMAGYAVIYDEKSKTLQLQKGTALTGTLEINGAAKFGQELAATLTGTNNTGTLTYKWYRSGENAPIATDTDKYTLTADDIGRTITAMVKSSKELGSITAVTKVVEKADGPAAPAAFTLGFALNEDQKTFTATIPEVENAEYSFDGKQYSAVNTKTDCAPNTEYTGYVRIPETDTQKASAVTSSTQTAPKLTVAAPVFKPDGTTSFRGTQTVEISCATPGASIYYTTDGTTPTSTGTIYSGAISLTSTTTIKAIAVKADMNDSAVAAATFTRRSSSGGGGSVSIPDTKIPTGIYEHGTVTVSPESASKGDTVTITVAPDKGYTLESLTVLDKDGKALALTDKGGGKYTFTMPAGKITVKAVFMDDNTMLNFFTDVHAEDYYYDAVLWAAQEGVTGGTNGTLFAPNAGCTRAQAVTFLWRAAGSPEPKTLSSFADVPADAYYAKAAAWAVENNVAKGVSETAFAPDTNCTRAQIVTFLWRAQQSPASGGENPFTDVSAAAYYYNAVLWAVENDVAKGVSETAFAPNDNCTRAQIVTLIYRCRK